MHSWANDLNALFSINGLISLLTLTILEIVLLFLVLLLKLIPESNANITNNNIIPT